VQAVISGRFTIAFFVALGANTVAGDQQIGREITIGTPAFRHEGMLLAVARSPVSVARDNGRLMGACDDGTVFVWSIADGKLIRRLNDLGTEARNVALSPDGKFVAVCVDKHVTIRSVDSGEVVGRPKPVDAPSALFYSPSGETLAVVNRTISFLRLNRRQSTEPVRHRQAADVRVVFSPDGRYAVSTNANRRSAQENVNCGKAIVWDTRMGQPVEYIDTGGHSSIRASFSADGQFILVTTAQSIPSDRCKVMVWEFVAGRPLYEFQTEQPQTATVHVVPRLPAVFLEAVRGKASDGPNKYFLQERSIETGHILDRYPFDDPISAILPDGVRYATIGQDTTIRIKAIRKSTRSHHRGAPDPRFDMVEAWNRLRDRDANSGSLVDQMSQGKDTAVDFLRSRLTPSSLDDRRVDSLIRALDDNNFNERERASRELTNIRADVMMRLVDAYEHKGVSEEAKRRLQLLVSSPVTPVAHDRDELRAIRAIRLLGRIGTKSARELLTTLASGYGGSRITNYARLALENAVASGGNNA
jgi:WD40 repeat protein